MNTPRCHRGPVASPGMSESDWYPTDEPCTTCGENKHGQTITTATAQTTRSVRNDWYTRCFNQNCPMGRLPQ
jgi:hypothetical protein